MFSSRFVLPVMLVLAGTPTLHSQTTDYLQSIESWHQRRVDALKRENGWLNLVGLYWMEPGRNSFGTGAGNRIVFPGGSVPEHAGDIVWEDGIVRLEPSATSGITVDGNTAALHLLFHPDSSRTPVAAANSYRWTVIKRDDKVGIRLRDLNAPSVRNFSGIPRYPVDTAWRLEAQLQQPTLPQQIAITNVLGQTSMQLLAGKLVFAVNGKIQSLDALYEGNELFVIFGDETNRTESYPSGRFLYVAMPDATGKTVIDFNKAINPPCAFTEYATCPLPPPQNRLSIAITAGEKNYHP